MIDTSKPISDYEEEINNIIEYQNIVLITGCDTYDCILFFNKILKNKDIPYIYPYFSYGEKCTNNMYYLFIFRIYGGPTHTNIIISTLSIFQRSDIILYILSDGTKFAEIGLNSTLPLFSIINNEYYIKIIDTSNLSENDYYEIFKDVRLTMSEGGYFVELIQNDKVLKNIINYFYQYLYKEDDGLIYYITVHRSYEYIKELMNQSELNNMIFLTNYDKNSQNKINLLYIQYGESYIGSDIIYDDRTTITSSLTSLILKLYVKENTTSFSLIGDNYFGLNYSYQLPIGRIYISSELYINVSTFIQLYDDIFSNIITTNPTAVSYPVYAYSQVINNGYMECINDEIHIDNNIRIAFISQLSGKDRSRYLSKSAIFTIVNHYLNMFYYKGLKYVPYILDTGDNADSFRKLFKQIKYFDVEAIFGGFPYLFLNYI